MFLFLMVARHFLESGFIFAQIIVGEFGAGDMVGNHVFVVLESGGVLGDAAIHHGRELRFAGIPGTKATGTTDLTWAHRSTHWVRRALTIHLVPIPSHRDCGKLRIGRRRNTKLILMNIERRVLCGGLSKVLAISSLIIGLATGSTDVETAVVGEFGNTSYVVSVHSIQ